MGVAGKQPSRRINLSLVAVELTRISPGGYNANPFDDRNAAGYGCKSTNERDWAHGL